MFLRCDGTITIDQSQLASCSTAWAENADDLTALLNQLASVNEFDPVKIGIFISFWMATLITGFGAGLVVRNMRRL
jgi:hypothetical protein